MTRVNQRPEEVLEVLDLSKPKETPSTSGLPTFGLGRSKVLIFPPLQGAKEEDDEKEDEEGEEETEAEAEKEEEEEKEEEDEKDSGRWDSDWGSSDEEYWGALLAKLPTLPKKPILPLIPRPETYVHRRKPIQPALPAMPMEERDSLKRSNEERYHHELYDRQLDYWEEDARIKSGYIRQINHE